MKRLQKTVKRAETHLMPRPKKPRNIDLTKEADCREFLKSMKVQGRQVTEFTLESGRKITVDQMSKSEAIQYANETYLTLYRGKPEGGLVDTDIDLGMN